MAKSAATVATIAGMVHDDAPDRLAFVRHRPHTTEQPFRLSLAQLLLWTAATALALFLLRPAYEQRAPRDWPGGDVPIESKAPSGFYEPTRVEAAHSDRSIVPVIVSVVVAPIYGAAILVFSAAVWVTVRGKGPLYVHEPGHWLLMIVGSAFLGVTLVYLTFDLQSGSVLWGFVLGAGFILIGLAPLLSLWACYEVVEPPAWNLAFRMLAAGALTCGCMPLWLIFFVALVTAVLNDVFDRQYRDLAHWLGVTAVFGSIVHIVVLAAMGT